MIRLARLFMNPFLDEEISTIEIINGATDTHQRLIANNPGAVYNGIISGLTTSLVIMDQCATDDIVKLGLRKGAKQAKDTFRGSLGNHIGKIYGKVTGHFGPDAPEVTTIFANGRTIFNECADDAVSHHLNSLITNLTPHAAAMGAIGAVALGDAGGLLSTWTGLFAASESSTGAKTTTEKEKRAAKENLAARLHIALLTIALQQATESAGTQKAVTTDQAEALAALYFRQDLFVDLTEVVEEEVVPPPPVP